MTMRYVERNVLQTNSGKIINLQNPLPEQFHIQDIAHGLANVCRFSGQLRRFYSVAAHSLLVCEAVRLAGGTAEEQLHGLLHDATEAYIQDVPSPVKRLCPQYKDIENRLWKIIASKYSLTEEMPLIVKWADDEVLDIERYAMLNNTLDVKYNDNNVKSIFLSKFDDLLREETFLNRSRRATEETELTKVNKCISYMNSFSIPELDTYPIPTLYLKEMP